jgi:hypothetical protein
VADDQRRVAESDESNNLRVNDAGATEITAQ